MLGYHDQVGAFTEQGKLNKTLSNRYELVVIVDLSISSSYLNRALTENSEF